MVRDIIDLRLNNWVPRREEVIIITFLHLNDCFLLGQFFNVLSSQYRSKLRP